MNGSWNLNGNTCEAEERKNEMNQKKEEENVCM